MLSGGLALGVIGRRSNLGLIHISFDARRACGSAWALAPYRTRYAGTTRSIIAYLRVYETGFVYDPLAFFLFRRRRPSSNARPHAHVRRVEFVGRSGCDVRRLRRRIDPESRHPTFRTCAFNVPKQV